MLIFYVFFAILYLGNIQAHFFTLKIEIHLHELLYV